MNDSVAIPQRPALTVVLLAPKQLAALRGTLKYLRAQSIANQIEVIVLGTSAEQLAQHAPEDVSGFQAVQFIPVGPIENVDMTAPRALPYAKADYVAFIEDHAYPQPGWAEAVVQASQRGVHVIGAAMLNFNPGSMLSWANLFIGYGVAVAPTFTGERGSVGLHNSAFQKAALLKYGEHLPQMMGRDGGLLQDMKSKGMRLYLPAQALLAHANPSRLRSTFQLRFNAGRSFGAQRAEIERWSAQKRLIYFVGGAAIPLVRFVRLYRDLKRILVHYDLLPRALPMLFLALIFDAMGQMVGYSAGYGKSREILAGFERDRVQHLNRQDRRLSQSL
jgi:hypothetical protein